MSTADDAIRPHELVCNPGLERGRDMRSLVSVLIRERRELEVGVRKTLPGGLASPGTRSFAGRRESFPRRRSTNGRSRRHLAGSRSNTRAAREVVMRRCGRNGRRRSQRRRDDHPGQGRARRARRPARSCRCRRCGSQRARHRGSDCCHRRGCLLPGGARRDRGLHALRHGASTGGDPAPANSDAASRTDPLYGLESASACYVTLLRPQQSTGSAAGSHRRVHGDRLDRRLDERAHGCYRPVSAFTRPDSTACLSAS